MKKRALILSGGSIRGAFQAGAIKGIIDQGFEPDIIHGISAGALNGAFLVNESGKYAKNPNWQKIGKKLEDIWLKEINRPSKLVRKRNPLVLVFATLFKKFKSLLDNRPLLRLIDQYVEAENLAKSTTEFLVGAVDYLQGDIEYPNQKDPDFLDYVIASSSIPIIIPYRTIKNKPYIDGGVRDVAPLRHVIHRGVDEIVVIVTQPQSLELESHDIGNIIPYLERVMQLTFNEILLNDLKELEHINQQILDLKGKNPKHDSSLFNKRYINCEIIWPEKNYSAKITDFSPKDIEKMFLDGYEAAMKSNPGLMVG